MKFEICITSYATGNFDYWEVYDLDSYIEALREFNRRFNRHDGDYEVQMIETEYTNVDVDDLYELFKYVDNNPNCKETMKTLIKCMSVSEAIDTINDDCLLIKVLGSNKEEAFIEYYKECGYQMPPEEFESYIKWDKIMDEFEMTGLSIYRLGLSEKYVNRFGFREYLTEYLFVREY